MADPDWERAACRGTKTTAMFPSSDDGHAVHHEIAAAKAICAPCPIKQPCLNYALNEGIVHGVWGGHTERERHLIRRKLGLVGRRTPGTRATR